MVYQDSRPQTPFPSAPKGNKKQETNEILPAAIEKKSNFVFSRKQPHVPSDYNL